MYFWYYTGVYDVVILSTMCHVFSHWSVSVVAGVGCVFFPSGNQLAFGFAYVFFCCICCKNSAYMTFWFGRLCSLLVCFACGRVWCLHFLASCMPCGIRPTGLAWPFCSLRWSFDLHVRTGVVSCVSENRSLQGLGLTVSLLPSYPGDPPFPWTFSWLNSYLSTRYKYVI